MAFFVRPLTQHEERVIRDLAASYHNDAAVLKRFQIILLSHQRMKSGEIARQLQVTPSTIVHWIKRFNQFGLNCFEQSLAREPSEIAVPPTESEPLFARSLTSVELELLLALMQQYQNRATTLRRLQAIRLSSQKKSVSEIVRTLGLSQKTVRLWIKEFNAHGIQRLETSGDKSWLNRKQTLATPVEISG